MLNLAVYLKLVQHAGLDPFNLPGNPQIACIGPKTAKVARELGFAVNIVAEPHTTAGLVAALQKRATQIPTR